MSTYNPFCNTTPFRVLPDEQNRKSGAVKCYKLTPGELAKYDNVKPGPKITCIDYNMGARVKARIKREKEMKRGGLKNV